MTSSEDTSYFVDRREFLLNSLPASQISSDKSMITEISSCDVDVSSSAREVHNSLSSEHHVVKTERSEVNIEVQGLRETTFSTDTVVTSTVRTVYDRSLSGSTSSTDLDHKESSADAHDGPEDSVFGEAAYIDGDVRERKISDSYYISQTYQVNKEEKSSKSVSAVRSVSFRSSKDVELGDHDKVNDEPTLHYVDRIEEMIAGDSPEVVGSPKENHVRFLWYDNEQEDVEALKRFQSAREDVQQLIESTYMVSDIADVVDDNSMGPESKQLIAATSSNPWSPKDSQTEQPRNRKSELPTDPTNQDHGMPVYQVSEVANRQYIDSQTANMHVLSASDVSQMIDVQSVSSSEVTSGSETTLYSSIDRNQRFNSTSDSLYSKPTDFPAEFESVESLRPGRESPPTLAYSPGMAIRSYALEELAEKRYRITPDRMEAEAKALRFDEESSGVDVDKGTSVDDMSSLSAHFRTQPSTLQNVSSGSYFTDSLSSQMYGSSATSFVAQEMSKEEEDESLDKLVDLESLLVGYRFHDVGIMQESGGICNLAFDDSDEQESVLVTSSDYRTSSTHSSGLTNISVSHHSSETLSRSPGLTENISMFSDTQRLHSAVDSSFSSLPGPAEPEVRATHFGQDTHILESAHLLGPVEVKSTFDAENITRSSEVGHKESRAENIAYTLGTEQKEATLQTDEGTQHLSQTVSRNELSNTPLVDDKVGQTIEVTVTDDSEDIVKELDSIIEAGEKAILELAQCIEKADTEDTEDGGNQTLAKEVEDIRDLKELERLHSIKAGEYISEDSATDVERRDVYLALNAFEVDRTVSSVTGGNSVVSGTGRQQATFVSETENTARVVQADAVRIAETQNVALFSKAVSAAQISRSENIVGLSQIDNAENTRKVENAESTRKVENAEGTREVKNAESARKVENAESTRKVENAEITREVKNAESTWKVENAESTSQVENVLRTSRVDNAETTIQVDNFGRTWKVDNVERTSQIDNVLRTSRVDNAETSQVDNVGRTWKVDNVERTSQVDNVGRTWKVDNVETTIQVDNVGRTWKVDNVERTSQVDNVGRTWKVDNVETTIQVDNVGRTWKVDNVERTSQVDNVGRTWKVDNAETTIQVDNVGRTWKVDNVERTSQVDNVGRTWKVDNVETTIQVDNFERTSQVDNVGRTWKVDNVETTSQVDNAERTSQVDNVGRTWKVDNVERTSQVDNVGRTWKVDNVETTSQVDNVGRTSQVDNVGRTSQVDNVETTSQVDNVETTSQVDNAERTSQVDNAETKIQVSDTKSTRKVNKAESTKMADNAENQRDGDNAAFTRQTEHVTSTQKAEHVTSTQKAGHVTITKKTESATRTTETDNAENTRKIDHAGNTRKAGKAGHTRKTDNTRSNKKADKAAQKRKADNAAATRSSGGVITSVNKNATSIIETENMTTVRVIDGATVSTITRSDAHASDVAHSTLSSEIKYPASTTNAESCSRTHEVASTTHTVDGGELYPPNLAELNHKSEALNVVHLEKSSNSETEHIEQIVQATSTVGLTSVHGGLWDATTSTGVRGSMKEDHLDSIQDAKEATLVDKDSTSLNETSRNKLTILKAKNPEPVVWITRRFNISSKFEASIKSQGAILKSESMSVAVYYDTADFDLTLSDCWLRSVNSKWQLHANFTTLLSKLTQNEYTESEDKTTIISSLISILKCAPPASSEVSIAMFIQKSGLQEFVRYTTVRKTYELKGMTIDLELPEYGFWVGSVTVPGSSKARLHDAVGSIDTFWKTAGVEALNLLAA